MYLWNCTDSRMDQVQEQRVVFAIVIGNHFTISLRLMIWFWLEVEMEIIWSSDHAHAKHKDELLDPDSWSNIFAPYILFHLIVKNIKLELLGLRLVYYNYFLFY